MYYLTDFCRVCLQCDNSLMDIMKKDNETEGLNKLKLCVSEVEWSKHKSLLMCRQCMDKLNSAFEFKCQCLNSWKTLENYLVALKSSISENKTETKICVSASRNDISQDILDDYVKMKKELDTQAVNSVICGKPGEQLYPTVASMSNNVFLASGTNHNALQNVILNLVPSTITKLTAPNFHIINKPVEATQPQITDINRGMFLNINNTLHKIYPIIAPTKEKLMVQPTKNTLLNQALNRTSKDVNISQLLTESKTEEVSVEVDPACFEYFSEPESSPQLVTEKDWDEVISSNRVQPESMKIDQPIPKLVPATSALSKMLDSNYSVFPQNNFNYSIPPHIDTNAHPHNFNYNLWQPQNLNHFHSFPPIHSKTNKDLIFEQSVDCSLGNHFMACHDNIDQVPWNIVPKMFKCEDCGEVCESLKSLRNHIKFFHMGKLPYKCEYCGSEYVLQSQLDLHMKTHNLKCDDIKDTVTLEDLTKENVEVILPSLEPSFSNIHYKSNSITVNSDGAESGDEEFIGPHQEHQCDSCRRSFASIHGLSRHKWRKHNEKTKKKYFVKGMKNARCDICNREFSTQSYLQLHIKLHYRRNNYRRKVFNKEDYKKNEDGEDKLEPLVELINETNNDESMEIPETSEKLVSVAEENRTADDDNCTQKLNENDTNISSEPAVTDVKSNDEVPVTGLNKGIKIKINLRKIMNSSRYSKTEEIEAENSMHCSPLNGTELENIGENQMDIDHVEVQEDNELKDMGDIKTSIDDTDNISNNCDQARNMASDAPRDSLTPTSEGSKFLEENENSSDTHSHSSSVQYEIVNGKPKCTFCCKLFSRKHDLKRHINNIHLKQIEYQCHLCSSKFYEAFHLTRHLRQHNSFILCTGCMKNFSALRDLKHHINTIHDGSAASQCGACGQLFAKVKYLKDHLPTHDRSIIYKCQICEKEFVESRELTKHLVGHNEVYSCSVCNKSFVSDYDLSVHFKEHSETTVGDEKKYECGICHNKYKKQRYLNVHLANSHSLGSRDVEVLIDTIDSEYPFE